MKTYRFISIVLFFAFAFTLFKYKGAKDAFQNETKVQQKYCRSYYRLYNDSVKRHDEAYNQFMNELPIALAYYY